MRRGSNLNAVTWEPSAPAAGPWPARLLFAHGFGCDQRMWYPVAQALPAHQRVLFDWPGSGAAHPAAYEPRRHATLDGYAEDLLALLEELGDPAPVVVAHSVAASIAALAAQREPRRLGALVMVAPSPCFLNDPPHYHGGFEREQLEGLLQSLADGHAAWSQAIAPTIMGNADRPALADGLAQSFCAMDPAIALRWARATFLADIRSAMPEVQVPCLLLACRDDALAPPAVGRWLRQQLPRSRLVELQATGHCPHMSAPAEVAAVLQRELASGLLER